MGSSGFINPPPEFDEMRILAILVLLLSLAYARSWGGDGLWEIREGDHIDSFNGFRVALLGIGSLPPGDGASFVNATYAVTWNGTPIDILTLAPGESRNLSIGGKGTAESYMLLLRLKELGSDEAGPYAETDVNSAIFYLPPPPALLRFDSLAGEDRLLLSWETSIPANASLLLAGGGETIELPIPLRNKTHALVVAGLHPDTSYLVNLTYCAASCGSSGIVSATLPEAADPETDASLPLPDLIDIVLAAAALSSAAAAIAFLMKRRGRRYPR